MMYNNVPDGTASFVALTVTIQFFVDTLTLKHCSK